MKCIFSIKSLLFALVIASLAAGSCARQQEDAQKPKVVFGKIPEYAVKKKHPSGAVKKPAQQTGGLASILKLLPALSFKNKRPGYDPTGRIDPFRPIFVLKTDTAKKKVIKRKRPLTPLEKIDLGQLKLVAIVRSGTEKVALVEEASGKGYIVEKGTYMGVHSGRVIKIEDDRLIIAEEMKNPLGKVIVKHTELRLPKRPGEF